MLLRVIGNSIAKMTGRERRNKRSNKKTLTSSENRVRAGHNRVKVTRHQTVGNIRGNHRNLSILIHQ